MSTDYTPTIYTFGNNNTNTQTIIILADWLGRLAETNALYFSNSFVAIAINYEWIEISATYKIKQLPLRIFLLLKKKKL